MALDQQTEMTAGEVDDVLSRRETGVLSLARDDEPYAIPISYGYDAVSRTFYLRLVSTEDSEKRQFLGSAPRARIVVYDVDGTSYRSVVAEGVLNAITTDELTVEHIEQYGRAKRPLFEIWADSKRDLDVQLYELAPDRLSGRRVELDDALGGA